MLRWSYDFTGDFRGDGARIDFAVGAQGNVVLVGSRGLAIERSLGVVDSLEDRAGTFSLGPAVAVGRSGTFYASSGEGVWKISANGSREQLTHTPLTPIDALAHDGDDLFIAKPFEHTVNVSRYQSQYDAFALTDRWHT